MSRKRRRKDVPKIARGRIDTLMPQAFDALREGNLPRARRYVELSRRIAMRTRIRMPSELLYCKACNAPLIPGVNCRVRLRSNRLVIHCLECDSVKRRPYLREKRGGRDVP